LQQASHYWSTVQFFPLGCLHMRSSRTKVDVWDCGLFFCREGSVPSLHTRPLLCLEVKLFRPFHFRAVMQRMVCCMKGVCFCVGSLLDHMNFDTLNFKVQQLMPVCIIVWFAFPKLCPFRWFRNVFPITGIVHSFSFSMGMCLQKFEFHRLLEIDL